MTYPTDKINLTVNYSTTDGFSFNYENCEGGKKVVNQACYLKYTLKDETGFGLSFAGVAFSDPFNDVITDVELTDTTATLYDPFTDPDQSVSFQFGFTIKNPPSGEDTHNLLLLSADPEVINQEPACPPPGHKG